MADGGAEERHDAADSSLGKSHCGPGAFDNNDSPVPFGKSTVGVIKRLALWETGGEAPLAVARDSVVIEASAAVADRVPLHVAQTHGDGLFKESAFRIG